MAYRNHNLMHRMHLDPEGTKKLLLEAYRKEGSLEDAAKGLGISKRTLWLYTHQLGIRNEFRAIKRLLRLAPRLANRVPVHEAIEYGLHLPDPRPRSR